MGKPLTEGQRHYRALGYALELKRKAERRAAKLRKQIARADELGSRYLGNANEAREGGNIAKAEKLEAKCQYWLDRSHVLRGNGPG
jgi:hypothetical protein